MNYPVFFKRKLLITCEIYFFEYKLKSKKVNINIYLILQVIIL